MKHDEIKNAKSVRKFLLGKYWTIFVSVIIFAIALNLIITRDQVRMTAHLLAKEIRHVVDLNRNEILDEIALRDFNALREHLRILKTNLGIDNITLVYDGRSLSTAQEPRSPLNPRVVGLLNKFFTIEPVKTRLMNDYGRYLTEIQVDYAGTVYAHTVVPMFRQVFATTLGILMLVAVIFYFSFRQIQKDLLQPLKVLSDHLKSKAPPSKNIFPTLSTGLKEIRDLQEEFKSYESLRDTAVIAEIAAQVAHDIRSPLSALSVASEDLSGMSESQRSLFRSAIQRISDIANALLTSQKPTKNRANVQPESREVALVSGLLQSLVSEKRTQFRSRVGIEIIERLKPSSYGLFSLVHPTEFKRVLSNLINNSVEAIETAGKVTIGVEGDTNEVLITVADTGRGIPKDVIPKLFKKGVSVGKQGGAGLGLYHAKTVVENWGGKISLDSTPGEGTRIQISLPQTQAPQWFLPDLQLGVDTAIAVLDDDVSIHHVWDKRISKPYPEMNVHHFYKVRDFSEWHNSYVGKSLSLVDYEFLDDMQNGIDVIRALGVAAQSILVTNRFEEKKIVDECKSLRVKLLPKYLAGIVRISVKRPPHTPPLRNVRISPNPT